jgi:class 3 adenylate cyclase
VYSVIGTVLTSLALIAMSVKGEVTSYLGFYVISYILSLLKVGLPPSVFSVFIPHWHFAPVYIGVYLLSQVLKDANTSSITFKALKFLQLELRGKDKGFSYESALAEICDSLNCARVSVLKINHDNSCAVFIFDKEKHDSPFQTLSLNTFPPAFSHSITMRKSLYHIKEEGELAERLRKKGDYYQLGHEYFSIVPIVGAGGELGAFACTGYKIDLRDDYSRTSFESAVQIFSGYFSRIMEAHSNAEKLNANEELEAAIKSIQGLSSFDDIQSLEHSLAVFSDIFAFKAFIGVLDESSSFVNTHATFGLDSQEISCLNALGLKKNDVNEVGPVPLAIKTGQPTFVNEVGLIKGLLTEGSQEFFKITSSEGIAVVPFDIPTRANTKTRAILYLISKSKNVFDEYTKGAIMNFVDALSSRLDHLSLHNLHGISESMLKASKDGLSHFLPKHLVDDYLVGKEVTESDYGFLMMLDLKGSTKLAHLLGNSKFHIEVENFQKSVNAEVSRHGWTLQQFVWDGFAFTCKWDDEGHRKLKIARYKDLIEPIFLRWKSALSKTYGQKTEITSLDYRICFSFGDTSRGVITEGQTKKWTFIGNAIAVVSKVEQAAKTFPGYVFCDASVLTRSEDVWVALGKTNQDLTIYGLVDERSSLEKDVA